MKASGIVALSSMELNSGLTAFADNQSDGSKSHIERYHRYDFDTKEESIEEKRDYLIKKKYPITVFTHEWAIMDDEQKIWSNFEQVFEGVNHIERKIGFF